MPNCYVVTEVEVVHHLLTDFSVLLMQLKVGSVGHCVVVQATGICGRKPWSSIAVSFGLAMKEHNFLSL